MGARIRDAEGDLWEQDPDGGWTLHEPDRTRVAWLPTREAVEMIFGPTSVVTE